MRNNFQSKSVPRGTRTIWRYLSAFILLFSLGIGQMWAADIKIAPTLGQNVTPLSYGLFTVAYSGTGSKISSSAITTSTNGAKITISFATTKADMYIKTITFSNLSNGELSTSDGTISNNVFTASSNKTSATFELQSASGKKGTVKISEVAINTGSNVVEVWDGFEVDGTTINKDVKVNGTAYTTAVDLTTDGASISSSNLSLSNNKKLTFTSEGKIYYIALLSADDKVLTSNQMQVGGTKLATAAWSGEENSVEIENKTGGGRTFSKIFVIADAAAPASAAPSITAQPATAAANYEKDAAATALSVTATGSGTLTYQWYKNTDNNNTSGTAIDGATSASYTPSTAAYGTLYYYCVVTNTESGKSGTTAKSNVSGAITVPYPATGAADVLFNIATGTSNTALGTASKEAHSASINTLTNFAAAGDLTVSGLGAGKDGLSTKLQTLSEKDASKYIYVTFNVADGYIFTINSVTTKVVAVSTAKTIEVALSDATTNEALSYSQATNSSAATHVFEFAGKAYEGTVTLKIYAYGATDHYRLAAPLTISGIVAVKPSPAAPTISAPDADQAAVYDLNDEIAALTITASGYPTPTYQWYSNSSASTEGATAIEGAQSASYTPANNVASDLYYYCVASNSQGSATSHYFHVTVNAPAVPTIYTETTALTLTSNKIATASETFTFSGANLGATDVTLVLASAVDGLTLSESSVTPTAGAIADTEVTVSYKSVVDVAEAHVNLYLKQGDDILHTIALTYSSTAGIEDLTSISAATTWDWKDAADAAYGTLGQNDMIVLANADVTWDAGFNALAIAGKLQHYYRDSKYAQGHELKFNTTIPGRVTVTFSNTGGKDVARAPRITDVNGSYAPTDEADGSKNTTAKTYSHNVAAGDVLIAGFEMQEGTPANMLRYYKVEFVPTYTVAYAANGGSGDMTDANAYVAGDEVTLLENAFTPASGYIWSGWVATYNDGEVKTLTIENNKFTMPAYAVTVTAQWEDVSKVAKIGDVKYESLEAALEHAADGTIELLQDIDVTAQVEIAAGVTATIDLAGHQIEYTGTTTLTSGVLLVHNGASLTINDSSDPDAGSIVAGNDAYAAVALTKAGDDAANPAILTVNGGTLSGYYYGITGNGSRHNTEITINGGTITGTCAGDNLGIYHPQNGTLTVNGGTITAYSAAIEMRAGELEINGGTFTATAPTFSCNPNGSGTTTVGAAIAIAQHTTKVDIAVTINGGEFNGEKAVNESNPQVNDPAPQVAMAITDGEFNGAVSTVDVDHFISGGIFDNEVSNAQCAENYVPKDNGDGTYGVKPKDGVAIISIAVPNGTGNAQTIAADNISGVIGGTATQKLQNGSTKLGSNGHYIGFTLANSETLKAGDVIRLNVSATNDATHLTLYQDASDANLVKDIEWAAATGVNLIPVPAEAVGLGTLYIYRKSSACNPSLSEFAILRPMQPMLTAFSVNGRDGVIDEVNKTVAVQIPYDAELDNLTIVDEVAWNAPAASDAKVVTTNGGDWVEAPATNTYRLTDKDGDYTVYTITLTRDVLKHTVSFNTHGGSAVASEEVEHNAYLAAAPTAPTKEDYLFQGWAETADGAIVDVTTFAITADKEFHAVWAAETGVIKLFDGEGNLNTTNFVSAPKNDDPIEIASVEYPCLAQFASNRTSLGGAVPADMVKYDATTDEAKIKMTFYNLNSSVKKAILYKYEEGAEEPVKIEIEVPGQEIYTTDFYEFNSAKNRSFYVCAADRSNIRVLQVKVVDNGANPVKQFGQIGYSLNLNKGRLYAKDGVEKSFEGLTLTASSEYKVYNNSNLATKAANSFTVASPAIMHVERSGGKYYVYQDPEDKGTLYSANADIELNTTGTWYISSETASSAASFTLIRFDLPKCEKPVVADLDDVDYCQGDEIDALTVSATVSDGGTMLYQWYKDDEAIEGAEAATYQPTADGEYYVVVVNTLADHQNSDATQSNTIAVTGHAGTVISGTTGAEDWTGEEVTISVTASGKNLSYAWFTCDDAQGTNPVAVDPAVNAAELNVTVGAADSYYKVVVSGDCGEAQEAVITVVARQAIAALVDVTGNMSWDFSKDGLANNATVGTDVIMANVDGVVNNDDFHSDNIMVTANKQSGTKLQASMIKFHTTVPGAVIVKFANTGSKTNYRYLVINDVQTEVGSKNTTVVTYAQYVQAGDVVLTVTTADGGNMFNFTSVEFKLDNDLEPARTDEWLAPGELGTICMPQGAVAVGADIYELVGKEPQYGKIVFETVEHMKPGKPYLFQAKGNRIDFILTDEVEASEPDNSGAMKGTFVDLNLTELENVYYFAQHALWSCVDLTSLSVPANRAYVKLDEVEPIPDPTPAPGRRRISLGVNGQTTTTGFEALNAEDAPIKLMINGQIFILRGEKLYDATGRLVK